MFDFLEQVRIISHLNHNKTNLKTRVFLIKKVVQSELTKLELAKFCTYI